MENYENKKFRDRASDLIIKSNLTQAELKEALGVSAGTISDLKNKKSPPPNAETLYKLSKFFNVSIDYLLGLSDVPSVDIDMKAVCDYTGLSQEAVTMLSGSSVAMQLQKATLDEILKSEEFWEIVGRINGAKNCTHFLSPNGDLLAESVWAYVSESHKNIPEVYKNALQLVSAIGLAPAYKQELTELICALFDRIVEYDKRGIPKYLEREETTSSENT